MSYEGNITCSQCGAEYELHKMKLTMRDKDTEVCEICGNELKKWNGAVMYTTTLIKKDELNK